MRKYRLFGILNPIDALLVMAVAVLIWGAYLLAQPQTVIAESGRLIRYTFELSERPAGFHESIEVGAPVYCAARGWRVGFIVDVYASEFLQDAPDEAAGLIRRTPVEGLEFTYIVIEAWADITDYSTNIGEFWVAVNRSAPLRSKDFAGFGVITNLVWEEAHND